MKKDISGIGFKSIAGWRGDSLCCPQAFGGDVFSGCSLNCWWCFCREMEEEMYTKYYDGWSRDLVRRADPDLYKNLFDRAFGSDRPTSDWLVQCLRQGLPFNMGSKSETFQYANDRDVVRVLELFREYRVPVIFETKSVYAGLAQYLDIIKNLNAAVIVAIMGGSDTLNYKLEPNCPPASSRWAFVRDLNDHGVWCGVRWEPVMPGINSSPDIFSKFAQDAKNSRAQHVSVYHYRSSNYYKAEKEFTARGYNYARMLELSLDENWRPLGKGLMDELKQAGVPVSTPDFVNFPFYSDKLSCCGTDDLFTPYLFNYQYALKLIRDRGKVCWEDMEQIQFRHPDSYTRMKLGWNGGGQYFGLRDCVGVVVLDQDKHGRNIYGGTDGASPRVSAGFDLL